MHPYSYDSVAILSDTHLSSTVWKGRPRTSQDSLEALQSAVTIINDSDAECLLMPGDLFDRKTNNADIVSGTAAALDLLRKDIHVLYIQGQHDLQDNPWMQLCADASDLRATHLTPDQPVELAGLLWAGMDYMSRADFQSYLKDVPEHIDGLITHQVWGEFLSFDGKSQASFKDVPAHISHVITGDLHKSVVKRFHRTDAGRLRVLSPGATHRRAINEPDEHYVYFMKKDPEDSAVPKLTRKKLATRPKIVMAFDDENLPSQINEANARIEKCNGFLPLFVASLTHEDQKSQSFIESLHDRAEVFWRWAGSRQDAVAYGLDFEVEDSDEIFRQSLEGALETMSEEGAELLQEVVNLRDPEEIKDLLARRLQDAITKGAVV